MPFCVRDTEILFNAQKKSCLVDINYTPLFSIDIQLIYNVPGVQKSDSVIYIYIYIYLFFFRFFSITYDYHKMLIKVPVLYPCFVSQIIPRIRRAKSLAQDHTVSCVLEGCLSPKHILLEQSVPCGSSVSPRLSEILSLVSLALTFDPVI